MIVIPYQDILSEANSTIANDIFRAGGVVIYPTDTLYGMGGNFYDPGVFQTVDRIKNRADMPYSVVVSDLEMLTSLVADIPPVFYTLYEKLLPGKFTFLFNVSPTIAPALVKGSTKIGIRIPAAPLLLQWVKQLGQPLLSTSVNRTGEPPLNDAEMIRRTFSPLRVDTAIKLLLDGGRLPASRGSTILDLTQTPIQCLRWGDESERVLLTQLDIQITP